MRQHLVLLWSALVWIGFAVTAIGAGASRNVDLPVGDINGAVLHPFKPAGRAHVMFFVTTDCPISNSYAPTIQQLCREYGSRGVSCSLMYEDLDTSSSPGHLESQVRQHLKEYRYERIPAAIDRARTVASRAKASVTPEAVVVDRAGDIRYRGRIDNLYAALGTRRRVVTVHDLRDALDAVLSGRSVANPETEALGCFIVNSASLRKS